MNGIELQEFREEVREFVRMSLPRDIRLRSRIGLHATKEDMLAWTRMLYSRGWSAPHWPVEHGGTGWSALQRMVFDIELADGEAPPVSPFGLFLIGPVIYTFGTDEQKRRYLPKILDGSEFWCQGYSEPNSGSDLASLRTSAIRSGEHYVVNGQKIWTSEAHYADMMFCLVRTDAGSGKQSGISMLLIDMKSEGVTVRPIVTQDMEHYVNEVFLENVRVPVGNLIGEENKGWTYAKFLLENERTISAYLPESKRDLKRLRAFVNGENSSPSRLKGNAKFDVDVAQVEIDLAAHELMIYRILLDSVEIDKTVAASMIKIKGAELRQQISSLWIEALGSQALRLATRATLGNSGQLYDEQAGAMSQFLIRRAVSIYGGTNEIQHNIIAKRGLGL